MQKLVVLLSVVCMAAAYGGVVPYSSVLPYSGVLPYSAVQWPYGGAGGVLPSPYLAPAVYPGYSALSQGPYSPAVVLDAARGVPLDTPEVVAARAAHYQAKALAPLHHLKKRSAPLAYSSVLPHAYSSSLLSTYSAPVVSPYSAPLVSAYSSPVVSTYSSPVVSAYSSPYVSAYSSPLAYHGVVPKALSVHPW